MEKSKKIRHSAICPDCNGNGYIKAILDEGRDHIIIQCDTCESEGELYVDESEIIESYINANSSTTIDKSKLN